VGAEVLVVGAVLTPALPLSVTVVKAFITPYVRPASPVKGLKVEAAGSPAVITRLVKG
jgi:hypothetical protein